MINSTSGIVPWNHISVEARHKRTHTVSFYFKYEIRQIHRDKVRLVVFRGWGKGNGQWKLIGTELVCLSVCLFGLVYDYVLELDGKDVYTTLII